MTTTIQRRSTAGPSTARRVPFPTPGPQPEARVSVLSQQGNSGAITAPPNIGTDAGVFTMPSTPPQMSLDQVLPAMHFTVGGSRTDKLQLGTSRQYRTYIAVIQFGDLHASGNAHIVKQTDGGANSLSVAKDGRLQLWGSGAVAASPQVAITPWKFHMVAARLDGANSLLQVDRTSAIVTTADSVGSRPLIVGGYLDATYQMRVLEVEAHTTALTAAQINEKYEFYRTLYQLG